MKQHQRKISQSCFEQTITENIQIIKAYFVYHSDTDNPHIHCDLKIKSIDGLRIDVKKADLENMRKIFAKAFK